ncbi:hypothetical protein V6Z12_D07G151600 [Gossypium hirsutum]
MPNQNLLKSVISSSHHFISIPTISLAKLLLNRFTFFSFEAFLPFFPHLLSFSSLVHATSHIFSAPLHTQEPLFQGNLPKK